MQEPFNLIIKILRTKFNVILQLINTRYAFLKEKYRAITPKIIE